MFKFIENIQSDIKERNSSLTIEIVAGISTFLSLSYIFVVNPSILAEAGMDKTSVLFATILISGLATIVMGLYARLPFVLAPGLEMNAYVAFVAVGALGLTWQESLGAVFWSGIIFVILTLIGIREKLIYSIPNKLKFGLAFSVGAFVFAIGLLLSGVFIYDGVDFKGIGSLTGDKAITLYIGLFFIIFFNYLKIPGSILLSIVIAAVYANYVGLVEPYTGTENSSMLSGTGELDIFSFSSAMITSIIILFLVDFYGSLAKFIGMTMNTEIIKKNKEGKSYVPKTKEALTVDGVATLGGAFLGTTSVTTYVESAVGISAGGRTGLVAIIAGLLMLMVYFLIPFINYIPVVATSGALVYVGYKLIPNVETRKTYSNLDYLVSISMALLAIFTFSLDLALILGFIVYTIRDYLSNKTFNVLLIVSIILLITGRLLQL
jgi:AGZA family xanthine/uracil permease-like MFS transporter